MNGNLERIIEAVSALAPGRRVLASRDDSGYHAVAFKDGSVEWSYPSAPWENDPEYAAEARLAIDGIVAEVDADYLDALPLRSIVRVVNVRSFPTGRSIQRDSIYQNFGYWTLLDPSDRYDGEYAHLSGELVNESRGYSPDGVGYIDVLYVPSKDER